MPSHRFIGGLAALVAGTAGALTVAAPAHAACLPPQYCGPAYVVPVSRTSTNDFSWGSDALTSMSADGRYVAFSSSAPLVPGDTNDAHDIYRRDMLTNTLVRVSTSAAGSQANDDSHFPALSSDGRYVAFMSEATNLLGGVVLPGAVHHHNMFRKDLQTGAIVKVNTKADGSGGGAFLAPDLTTDHETSISANGRYVAFTSNQGGLVTPASTNASEVYRKDLTTGAITRVSVAGAALANGASSYAALSADGRYVAFQSTATNLVPDGNGQSDVFRKDLTTGTIVRVSVTPAGSELGRSIQPAISDDGRYVSFTTTVDSSSNVGSIQRKDLVTGTLDVVSASAAGTPATGINWRSSISGDGQIVVFESTASTLVAGDTNASTDLFVKNVGTGAIRRVSKTTSAQQAPYGGSMAMLSDDGQYVSFWTPSPLTPADDNNAWDTYRTNVPFGL